MESFEEAEKVSGTNGTVLDCVKPFTRICYLLFAGVVEARFWAVLSARIDRVDA